MSDPALISKVAAKLRPVSKDVLKGKGKLCMSTVYLKDLNRAFDDCHPDASSFHLTETRASMQTDLRFLLDLVKGTANLKLTSDLIKDEDPANISRFHNVTSLEIDKVDVKRVVGIQKLRPRLQHLTCRHNLDNVSDILDKCGADFSRSFNWGELKVVNFAYNHITSVDSIFDITPLLQKLDLSHNHLREFDLINCLPQLKELNLSYNKLEKAPRFKGPVCKQLHILQLNNNFIEEISGLAPLSDLQQLDLTHNCLLDHSCLLSVSQMGSLYFLDLRGNPLNFHPIHRTLTSNYLHKNITTSNFILDNVALSKTEKTLAGSLYPLAHQSSLRSSGSTASHDSLGSLPKKHTKGRTVYIRESDDVQRRDLEKSKVVPSPKHRNTDYLDIKSKVNEMLSKGESLNPTFEEIFNFRNDPAIVVEPQETHTPESVNENNYTVSSNFEETFETAKTNSSDVVDEEDTQPEILRPSENPPSDDEDVLQGKTFMGGTTGEANDLFIIITPTHVSERDSISMKERARWSLDVVKSCNRGDAANEVAVKFDVPRADRKTRTYYMDDHKSFVQALLEGMTRNKMPERRIEYLCMKCDCSFSLPQTSGKKKVTCPKCESNHVIESK